MKRRSSSCCGTPSLNGDPPAEIPKQIQRELNAIGGLEGLARRIPAQKDLETTARVCHALSDPLRLIILYLVSEQPLCVCVINRFVQLSGPKLSYHLNILKGAGLIKGEYHGNWIIYSITGKGRDMVKKSGKKRG